MIIITLVKLPLSINTPGVGLGRNSQYWLKGGDIVEVKIEGIGSVTNKITFGRTNTDASLGTLRTRAAEVPINTYT